MKRAASPRSSHRSDPPTSPIHLADQLLSLARAAEIAGMPGAAHRLIGLAFAVLDGEGSRLH